MALLRDLRFAGRTLRRNPGFTVTALLTIALGIGASTAIFSVVNAVLLRPLPYKDPERLVLVWGDLRNRHVVDFPFSNPDFADLRTQTTLFEGLAAVTTGRTALAAQDGRDPELVKTANATTNVFSVLGLPIEQGRDFAAEDGTAPTPPIQTGPAGAALPPPPPALPRIVILSHEFWVRHFGGDLRIVGESIRFGNGTAQVVGVLAAGAELLFPPGTNMESRPDVWSAMRVDFTQGSRNDVGIRVIGRLKAGATLVQAKTQVDAVAAELRSRFPIKQTAGLYFRIEPMRDDLVADVRPTILALMGAVGFVLLIACANVANLLLSRSSVRERELAVRAALGAGEWRLVRQLLAESLALALGGALVGLLLAQLGIRLLLRLRPDKLPRIETVSIDPVVLAFAAFAALLSAVAFGLVPAFRAARPDLMEILRKTGRTPALGSGSWLRSGVVTAEVALSFVLWVGSGLLLRSFVALQQTDPGYDPRGLLTFTIGAVRARTPQERAVFIRECVETLRTVPGAQGVTAAGPFPLDGGVANGRWGPETAAADPSQFQQANVHIVLPGYFDVMRTRLLEGRTFTEADNNANARVIVIDSLLAARAFPQRSAVGKRLLARIRTEEPEVFEVIGVVAHERHESVAHEGREAMFFADGLVGPFAVNRWAIRTTGDPMAQMSAVRQAVGRLDPHLVVSEIQPMTALVDQSEAQMRFALVLIGIFAGIAAVLASVGLYGVLSTTVRQRTAEIGVRIAFGAGRARVFGLVVRQGLRLSAIGIAIGLAVALSLTGVLKTMLVGVQPTDPLTFASIGILFLVVATAACGVPAFRAARLDPIAALREE